MATFYSGDAQPGGGYAQPGVYGYAQPVRSARHRSSNMSGLNASLGYFIGAASFGIASRVLLRRRPRLHFLLESAASFVLAACLLEVQTIVEVGQWAGGLGPDVSVTVLFVVLLTHGVVCGGGGGGGGASGNPALTLARPTAAPTLLAFLGAHLALMAALHYWSLELTDMHLIKNLMSSSCSTSLQVSVLQGFITESVCTLVFHLVHLSLRRRSALIRIPLVAVLLTFLSHTGYTSAYMNPSLAYGLTFHCPGFTLAEYAAVYWLGPLTGMSMALFLYMGHIPRVFSKNLLYSQKTRFRVPKGNASGEEDKKKK
ncbi:Aquaporin-12 [Merluccius polli]|uniref:Aquaporin-12 n=1 Tax=Merluccius polli TaxID=89951 RepID=A0AA47NC31_MERPO|nr:Aquaporin-12 [Merluccius polli]